MKNLLPDAASEYLARHGVKHNARSLRQYRYRGIGPCFIKIAGTVHYPIVELDAYIAQVTSAPSRSTKDHRSIAERLAGADKQSVTA